MYSKPTEVAWEYLNMPHKGIQTLLTFILIIQLESVRCHLVPAGCSTVPISDVRKTDLNLLISSLLGNR